MDGTMEVGLATAGRLAPARIQPYRGLSRRRRLLGTVGIIVGLPLLTLALVPLRGTLADASLLLVYLLAVVAVAAVGGLAPALVAALASFLLANWFLTPPYYTLTVASRDAAVDLVVFVVVGAVVSVVVELGARHREAAARTQYESVLLSELGSAQVGTLPLTSVLERVRTAFGMRTVQLLDPSGPERVLSTVGPPAEGEPSLQVTTTTGLRLTAYGPQIFAEDRRMLAVLADMAVRAWDEQQLARQAARAEQLAETDRVRTGLLSAVGHDLRTPLAGIKAAVSSLRQPDVDWSQRDRDELLATVEESTDRLSGLIENLLSMSRLQVGAVSVHPEAVSVEEAIGRVLLHAQHQILLDAPEDLPLVLADPGLLERVLDNLVDNAVRHTPHGTTIEVHAHPGGDADAPAVCISVIDHGPGIPPQQREHVFAPFQRRGDTDTSTGIGLGLAIARGFTDAMHGCLSPSSTPGGGLTMTVCLPVAP
jgi:K+-sensing histidine kinase KdpD